ncbi:hypothetical protein PGIGA_G00124780 [Pangasianodon gigas]|uniref:Uncharacterized protein n=1 Tax=Pangasianodon gigas TaxID=30993 RepID=A0ACC5XH92_PANGG|nr:hypothetical protein [Pangasianodon gigas]
MNVCCVTAWRLCLSVLKPAAQRRTIYETWQPALSRHGPPLVRQRGRQPQPAQKEAQTALLFLLFLLQLIREQSDQPQQTLEQTKPLTLQRERQRQEVGF